MQVPDRCHREDRYVNGFYFFSKPLFVSRRLENRITNDESPSFLTNLKGYQVLKGYSKGYRSNTRRIIFYSDLQEIIWDRVKSFMTPTQPHKALKSTWRVNGLNPQFRFCRYTPGQKFAPHYDGDYIVDSTEKSLYTFMIYLNGGFEGGATNFLSDSATSGPRGRVLHSLPPQAGMLLVFEHNIYHEGEELRDGVKYMMRSDLMYKLDPVKTESEDADVKRVQEAQELLALAEQSEAQGKLANAVTYYKKAYKLAPELEHRERDEESSGSDADATANPTF